MSDVFLDMLATPAKPIRRRDLEIPGVRAYDAPTVAGIPTYKPPAPTAATPTPIMQPTVNSAAARPDIADDIDQIVRELVAAGNVVFDAETDTYRAPHCRTFKFGGVHG